MLEKCWDNHVDTVQSVNRINITLSIKKYEYDHSDTWVKLIYKNCNFTINKSDIRLRTHKSNEPAQSIDVGQFTLKNKITKCFPTLT